MHKLVQYLRKPECSRERRISPSPLVSILDWVWYSSLRWSLLLGVLELELALEWELELALELEWELE